MNVEIGTERPRYSISENICFEISVFCLCSVCPDLQVVAVVSCLFVVVSTLCLIISTLPSFQQKDANGIVRKYTEKISGKWRVDGMKLHREKYSGDLIGREPAPPTNQTRCANHYTISHKHTDFKYHCIDQDILV
jgi:hypothetical protein